MQMPIKYPSALYGKLTEEEDAKVHASISAHLGREAADRCRASFWQELNEHEARRAADEQRKAAFAALDDKGKRAALKAKLAEVNEMLEWADQGELRATLSIEERKNSAQNLRISDFVRVI